jgi:mono/diheme cytochrome c family protein
MLVYEHCGFASQEFIFMSGALRVALLSSSVIAAVSPVQAQDGDTRRGLALARETCAVCHGVREDELSPNSSAPPFELIAAVPGMSRLALQSMLQTSHREMPNFILQADERADLIAYILSLKVN